MCEDWLGIEDTRLPVGGAEAIACNYDRAYFDALYADSPDPWNFRASPYEQAKYAATVNAISDRRYQAGLEVGCSIGELSALLAPLCDSFLGLDIAEQPLKAARIRCAALPQARFECRLVPTDRPAGRFDLIVLSEVLYFMSEEKIREMAEFVRASLLPGGRVLLVNWLGAVETPQPGDIAAQGFIAAAGLQVAIAERQSLYRLDLLARSFDVERTEPRPQHWLNDGCL
jgi:cyclopropane fatty-acyl-phospholipid synthase-like methyltransferase